MRKETMIHYKGGLSEDTCGLLFFFLLQNLDLPSNFLKMSGMVFLRIEEGGHKYQRFKGVATKEKLSHGDPMCNNAPFVETACHSGAHL